MSVWDVFMELPYGMQMMVVCKGFVVCRNFGKLKGDRWDWIDNVPTKNVYQNNGMVVCEI